MRMGRWVFLVTAVVAAPAQMEQKMHSHASGSAWPTMMGTGMMMGGSGTYQSAGMTMMMMGMSATMEETPHGMGMTSRVGYSSAACDGECSPFGSMRCGEEFGALLNNDGHEFHKMFGYCDSLMPAPPAPPAPAVPGMSLGVCNCHPESITFSISGGGCSNTDNYQSLKMSCEDVDGGSPIVPSEDVSVNSVYGDVSVTHDEATGFYTMSGLGAQTYLQVLMAGEVSQSLSIHTSCSKPFGTGDIFGAITVEGFTCGSGGRGMSGTGSMMGHSASSDGGCNCRPEKVMFTYKAGGCGDTTNFQGGKMICTGDDLPNDGSAVEIMCDNGVEGHGITTTETPAWTETSNYFTLGSSSGRLSAQTDCAIIERSSGLVQELSIHTSCSQGLYAGDRYGALEVVAWDCGSGAMVPAGVQSTLEQCIEMEEAINMACTQLQDVPAFECMCEGPPPPPPTPSPLVCVEDQQAMQDGGISDPAVMTCPAPSTSMGPEMSFFTCSHQPCSGDPPALIDNGDGGPCFEVTGGAPDTPLCVKFGQNFDGTEREICSPPMPAGCCPDACAPRHLGVVVRYVGDPPVCECHPNSMTFEYVGGGCEQSTHDQEGKMVCGGGPTVSRAYITCESGDPLWANVGETFTLGSSGGRLGAQTDCTISVPESSYQMVSIHTSCSKKLEAGDVYGALKVVSWDCGGSMAASDPNQCSRHPSCITFTYSPSDCTATHDQSGKFSCSGDVALSGLVEVSSSTTLDGQDGAVAYAPGDSIGVGCGGSGWLAAQTYLSLQDEGGNVQGLSIHTSCSKPLAIGDKFGSLVVASFDYSGGGGGSGTMGTGWTGTMTGSWEDDSPAEGMVMVSFFSDGVLVGEEEMAVPLEGGVHTCDSGETVVGDGNVENSISNTMLYPHAVPDDDVPGIADVNECAPAPSPSQSPSPSITPSIQPVYQLRIEERKTLCTTFGCIDTTPWDNITTRINMWYQRAVPKPTLDDPDYVEFTNPPISELTDADLSTIRIYSKVAAECHDPENSDFCDRSNPSYWENLAQQGVLDMDPALYPIIAAEFLPYCTKECIFSEWIPTFFVSPDGEDFSPKTVQPEVYPNFQDHEVVGMVVDCKGILTGEFKDFEQARVATWPLGENKEGPCWEDLDYGREVCAPGGAGLPAGVEHTYFIDGSVFPPDPNANGNFPRWEIFSCPKASQVKKEAW